MQLAIEPTVMTFGQIVWANSAELRTTGSILTDVKHGSPIKLLTEHSIA